MGDSVKNPVLGRRRVILDGAAEILAENGFHRARMAQIAGASGITGPALYRHFAGKDALHAAVIERGTDVVEAAMQRAATARAPAPSSRAVLDATIAGLARAGIEHAPLWVILLRDARHLADDDRARHKQRWSVIIDDLTGRINDVRTDLERWEAELLARAMLSLCASPTSVQVRGMTDPRRRRLLERMLAGLADVRFPDDAPMDAPPDNAPDLPPPLPRTSRREAIIGAAHHLFRGRGFHEVSMEDIAVAAGVTGPTLYSYFESKTDLLVVARQRGSAWLILCLERALRAGTDPAHRLTDVLTSFADFALEHGDTMAVLVREACNLPEYLLPAVQRDHQDYTTEVTGLLRSVRADLDEPPARMIVSGCLDLISALAVTRRYVRWYGLRSRILALLDGLTAIPAV